MRFLVLSIFEQHCSSFVQRALCNDREGPLEIVLGSQHTSYFVRLCLFSFLILFFEFTGSAGSFPSTALWWPTALILSALSWESWCLHS